MSRAPKVRKHTLVVTVVFDKKCTRAFALRETRDCIHGRFYTSPREDADPGSFRVQSVHTVPQQIYPRKEKL